MDEASPHFFLEMLVFPSSVIPYFSLQIFPKDFCDPIVKSRIAACVLSLVDNLLGINLYANEAPSFMP